MQTMLMRYKVSRAEWLFQVTAGDEPASAGEFCLLCALAKGTGVRYGGADNAVYQACVDIAVKIAAKIGMLNYMSGARRDTPLMKACGNGSYFMAERLINARARSPHLG